MRNRLLATVAIVAALAGISTMAKAAPSLQPSAFQRDGGMLTSRPRAGNYTTFFNVTAVTGTTISVPSSVATTSPIVDKNGSVDIWSDNDGWVCFGTSTQTCPATLPTPTSTPSNTIVSAANRGIHLMPIDGAKIISATFYAKVSATEFWVDFAKPKGE